MFTFREIGRKALLAAVVATVLLPCTSFGADPRSRWHAAADQYPALSLNKEHDPNPGTTTWQLGVPITYVISVRNGGVANAHVTVNDTLPDGFVVTGTICTPTTGAHCPGTLAAPSFGEFNMDHDSEIVLRISGYYTKTGDKLNEATAVAKDDAGNLLPVGNANKDSDPIFIPTPAVTWDLGITKTVTPVTTTFPAKLHYKIVVTNAGQPLYANGILKVRDVLYNFSSIAIGTAISNYTCAPAAICPDPPGQFAPAQISGNSAGALNLQWTGSNAGFIPANATLSIEFDVDLTIAATCGSGTVTIRNDAFFQQANSNTAISDLNISNNSSTVSSTLTHALDPCPPAAGFTVAKTAVGSSWDTVSDPNDAVKYTVTITNPNNFTMTNVDLTDRIYKSTGTPPFSAKVDSGPSCPLCSSALVNVMTNTPTITADGAASILWSARIPSIAPSSSVVVGYSVLYSPVCESDSRPNAIHNQIAISPSNSNLSPRYANAVIGPPEAGVCELDVEKEAQFSAPIVFGTTYKYKVLYKNTGGVARTVGTVRDTIMVNSNKYGNIPFNYKVTCSGTGISPLPSVPTASGTITNVARPWLGLQIINATNVTFPPMSTMTCFVEVTLERPLDSNPFCQGAGDPQLVNAAYMDLSSNYNPNSTSPPGFYDEVSIPLPLCRKVVVTKVPSAKNFGPGAMFSYTVKVENQGKDPVSGVTLNDAVPSPLVASGVSGCTPAALCLTGPTRTGNLVTVGYATLPVNQPVTFDITVQAPQAGGSYNNTAIATFVPGGNFYFQGDETKLLQNLANITVVTPTLTKSFTPGRIPFNGTSTLAFTITNTTSDPQQSGISFSDMLPPGLKIGGAVTSDCGGNVLVSSDGRTISLSSGQLAAGKHTCRITAQVSALGVCGTFTNDSTNFSNVVNLDVSNAQGKLEVVECPSGLVIQKNVAGAPAGWSGAFTFNVSCTGTPAIQKTVTVQWPSPGFTTITDIPRGSVCTVTEGPLPGGLPHDYTWSGSPVYTPGGGKVEITDQGGTVSVKNTMSKDERDCLRIIRNEAVCEVDRNGRPTGRYVWRFQFENLSGTPISQMFVAGLPSPVAAVPVDYAALLPAVTGVSPVIEFVFANAQPGPLSFDVSMLDQSRECCAMHIEVELPPCDCAQVLNEVTPRCFPSHAGPPPYSYTFSLQNFSGLSVGNVLVSAVSPIDHLTPIAATAIAVDSGVNPVTPVPPGGTIGPITVSISGPQAIGGKEVCLNLSLQTEGLDDCCSVVRCFRLPNCAVVFDHDYTAFGEATLFGQPSGFRLENIGVTGNDGVRIDVNGARAAGLTWRALDADGPHADGAFIELAASGDPGTASGSVRVTQSEGRYRIRTAIANAHSYRIDVFDAGQLVGTARNQINGNVIVIWPVAARAEVIEATEEHAAETLGFSLFTNDAVTWQLSDGSTLTGNRFRITSEEPAGRVSLQQLELRASGIPAIDVTGVTVFHDCNANGTPDAEDIANGTSADANGDGAPDECEDANDLDVSLNTGYDEDAGALLAPGADDDDWRVTVSGSERAAKVLTSPAASWPAALPDSRWISIDGDRGTSVPDAPTLAFERCFCIGENARDVVLDMQLRADDIASVSLNGVRLGDAGGAFNGAPLRVTHRGEVGASAFRAGSNCLRVDVIDSGGVVTGLDVIGSIRGTDGACETP